MCRIHQLDTRHSAAIVTAVARLDTRAVSQRSADAGTQRGQQ